MAFLGVSAQGTIEYLVIIAIVVVISLVTVGLVSQLLSGPSGTIGSSSSKFGSSQSSITIVDATTDAAGDSLISLQNNSGESVRVSRVSFNGCEDAFNEVLSPGKSQLFSLSSLDSCCPCGTGQASSTCVFNISYTTPAGLEKTMQVSRTVECVSDLEPVVTPVQPIVPDNVSPVVSLISPASGAVLSSRAATFSFSVSDVNSYNPNSLASCTLYVNGGRAADKNSGIVSGANSISYTFASDVIFDWNVSCNDLAGNTGRSGTNTAVDMDANASEIKTCLELQNMNNNLSGIYVLMNNIDCFATSGWNSGAGFLPVGSDSNYFSGRFDGKGYTISGLFINRTRDDVGLFGAVGSNKIIKNVFISNATVTGNNYVGVLIGYSYGIVSAARVSGSTVTGSTNVGGLIGKTDDAESDNGTVTTSSFSGTIHGGSSYIGGLIGYCNGEGLSQSFTQCTITSNSGLLVGGLVGYNSDMIQDSYSQCSISVGLSGAQSWYVGGIAGESIDGIINTYSTGSIGGGTELFTFGGLVGRDYGGTTDSFVTGFTAGDSASSGEVVGDDHYNSAARDYFVNLNPGLNNGHGTAVANASVFFGATHSHPVYANWDFNAVWTARDNNYPILKWQTQ